MSSPVALLSKNVVSVAELLEKFRIGLTKSRARRSNDNRLVESKNGSVIRKLCGYSHTPTLHQRVEPIKQYLPLSVHQFSSTSLLPHYNQR
jgi:hypothetical protein